MDYRSPLGASFSLEDSLASQDRTPPTPGKFEQSTSNFPSFIETPRNYQKYNSRKRYQQEPRKVDISLYYHPSMVEDPWKHLKDGRKKSVKE